MIRGSLRAYFGQKYLFTAILCAKILCDLGLNQIFLNQTISSFGFSETGRRRQVGPIYLKRHCV
jgi:hypothetical protein